jgi:trehalose 6-phosphate phosphatase
VLAVAQATPYSKVETDDKLRGATRETRRRAGLSGRLAAVMSEPPRTPTGSTRPDASAPGPDRRAESLVLRGARQLATAVRAVAREPRATALFCDIDGTVSPIVSDPYAAVVPSGFRTVLTALAPRLGLLAFVTGRDVRQAAAMVGIADAVYVGLHGFDVLTPGGVVSRDPAAEPYVDRVQAMAQRVSALDAEGLGLVVENKGPMLDLHYRRAPDPQATLAVLEREILQPARALGLAIATGHFLVELRPPVPVSKGTAVRRLLATAGRDGAALRTALFLGDDLTDRTGFAAVHAWAEEVGRAPGERLAFGVAALTDETPPEVRDEADVVVAATPGVYEVLTGLLEALSA